MYFIPVVLFWSIIGGGGGGGGVGGGASLLHVSTRYLSGYLMLNQWRIMRVIQCN